MAILEEIDDTQVDLSGDGGVMKKIVEPGNPDDQPSPQCKVKVKYTGMKDGEKFDSTSDREKPFEFVLHRGNFFLLMKSIFYQFLFNFIFSFPCSGKTIEGFDLGVASMNKGEKAILTIQAGYAIKPGHTQMDKMLPSASGEKPEMPQILPDVPENMAREDKVVFEVNRLHEKCIRT